MKKLLPLTRLSTASEATVHPPPMSKGAFMNRSAKLPDYHRQCWTGETDVINSTNFAGQQMLAMQWAEDGTEYALIFLGKISAGFESLDCAKNAARDFAISVLTDMTAAISKSV